MLALGLLQLHVGPQVHGAQALAVALGAVEDRLNGDRIGQVALRLQLGLLAGQLGRAVQGVGHLAQHVVAALAGGIEPGLRAGRLSAGARHGFQRVAGGLVGGGERRLAFGQPVGSGPAGGFRLLDGREQEPALADHLGGCVLQAFELRLGFIRAGLDGGEARARAARPLAPGAFLGGDGVQALGPAGIFPPDAVEGRPCLGAGGAALARIGAGAGQFRLQQMGVVERLALVFRLFQGRFGLFLGGGEAGAGLGQGRQAGRMLGSLALGGGQCVAGKLGLALGGAPGLPGRGFRLGGGGEG